MNKTRIKKISVRIFMVLCALYVIGCSYMFFFQESFLFHPEPLKSNHRYSFEVPFEEIPIKTADGKILSSVLFKADSSKGLVFYLHGNAGNIQTMGDMAKDYTDLNYDLFILDYRGFGKSEGELENEDQLFKDVQRAYDNMRKRYGESNIIVMGYSMGSGIAAELCSHNAPKELMLLAPYYSMVDMMQSNYPIVPTFLLNYRLETNQNIQKCRMPITFFHGNEDEVIPYNSSVRLKKLAKKSDRLITLKGQLHNGVLENKRFLEELERLLAD